MPYTYIITHLPSNVKYYGVRYAKKCDPSELGKTYFSSSKLLKNMIKEQGIKNFKFEVRKKFTSKQKALNWETKFLNKVNAAESSEWFNLYNTPNNFRNKGSYKLSETTKQKMRKPKSEEHRKKLEEHLNKIRKKPVWDEKRKNHHSNFMKGNTINKGKKHSEETKNKIKKAVSEKLKGNSNGQGKHNLKEVKCPHCGKVGKGPNMTRYHFTNCKNLA